MSRIPRRTSSASSVSSLRGWELLDDDAPLPSTPPPLLPPPPPRRRRWVESHSSSSIASEETPALGPPFLRDVSRCCAMDAAEVFEQPFEAEDLFPLPSASTISSSSALGGNGASGVSRVVWVSIVSSVVLCCVVRPAGERAPIQSPNRTSRCVSYQWVDGLVALAPFVRGVMLTIGPLVRVGVMCGCAGRREKTETETERVRWQRWISSGLKKALRWGFFVPIDGEEEEREMGFPKERFCLGPWMVLCGVGLVATQGVFMYCS